MENLDKMDDMEVARGLGVHLINPCVEPKTGINIRNYYIKESQKTLPKLKNPDARSLLEDLIGLAQLMAEYELPEHQQMKAEYLNYTQQNR